MREIEEQFADDVVVIGVHSGKYIAERETVRIREASLRYGITHPIVNDRQFRVWRSYAVRAWPTLAVIDRNGYVVGAHAGEFTSAMLQPLLQGLVSMSVEGSKGRPIHFPPERPGIDPGFLRYPGKVAVNGEWIAISDTGNHRVIVGTLETDRQMRVQHTVTALSPGSIGIVGGPRTFHSPQGLAFDAQKLYVADSENHTVYLVDLASGKATVLAGTGTQLRTPADRESGALSSPWDLVVLDETLYVAMAGVHQLWAIDARTGAARVHCGTGGEDIVDGPHSSALLAQPMGITTDGKRLYFADSESSAIRWADVDTNGKVGTIVGTGLFDFGDVDGIGEQVRMQHQQGVTRNHDGELLIADSYNDALKWLNLERREVRTWLRGFHEPGGVAAGEHSAYIADTNSHRIIVADYKTATVEELEIAS
ncbi:MAG: alkyl hydroperoxide reductase [Gemmatimonadota bacterium]|nr:alkyl hydroperoxide reductase [Gemmatimonadota bacterium]